MNRLAGKVAIITGAGRGQGRAAALLFSAEGAFVVAADVDASSSDETAGMIAKAGGKALAIPADVSNSADVEQLVSQSVAHFGGLDILYNNAAIWSGGDMDNFVTELDEDNWDRIVDVNLKGIFLTCKYAIPRIVERGGGVVINTSSIAGIRASRNRSHAYSASKGGVIALTKAMSASYARDRVRVNAICPGGVDTPMIASMMNTEERAVRFAKSHPLGRMGQPEDIANCALYLASDESEWVTGAVFTIDGGYSA
ncbi:MAG: glucose 1-dehydrogenase [Pseudomonadota bacterium]